MLNTKKKSQRRLSLTSQIIAFSSVFLLALPWLGYRYMDEMKEFLIQGQGDAQLLAARAIATILYDRSDLLNNAFIATTDISEEHLLYVYPLKHKPVVDGYANDWNESFLSDYSDDKKHIYQSKKGSLSALAFSLSLAEHSGYIYGWISVTDTSVVYRHPGYRRLDSSDQVRVKLLDNSNTVKRYAIVTEAPGVASVYAMQEDWVQPVTGKPEYALTAIWKDTDKGYDLEFRLPEKWISHNQKIIFSIADVNDQIERHIETVVTTLPPETTEQFNTLITRSPELERIIRDLGYADASICIVDRYNRIRAVLGRAYSQSQLCTLGGKVEDTSLSQQLLARSNLYRTNSDSHQAFVIASHPVYQDDQLIATVLVEKSSANIIARQRSTLNKIIIATAALFTTALLGLALFSSLLAYRIRKLQREVSTAIDTDGRLVRQSIVASRHAGDEIGELSRVFSTLLSQLKSYTGFLESVPRTLRHEILNPLNTISMALQKMESGEQYQADLIESANQALRQLELIVHSLTEAAHIEDALTQDEKIVFDIAVLLTEYTANIRMKHPEYRFSYTGLSAGIRIRGSDLRISQLLDKLKDNALDFSAENSTIEFELDTSRHDRAIIRVCNQGDPIPDNIINNLCDNILSHRSGASTTPHLGIGLFVASRIANYHAGTLSIKNNRDGVCVHLSLPVHAG